MYKLFLTFRYLTRRPLSLVSMFVLIGAVTVLVVAPSIMSGFQEEFHKRLRGALSDVAVWSGRPHSFPEDPEVAAYLGSLPNVVAVSPYLENPALDKHLNQMDYCFLRGIDPEGEEEVSDFKSYFLSERATYLELEDPSRRLDAEAELIRETAETLPDEVDLPRIYRELNEGSPLDPDLPTVAAGIYYLKSFDLRLGDTVRLTSASNDGEVNEDKTFLIVAAFQTGRHEFDRRLLLMSIQSLQDFIDVPGRVTGYSMRLDDYQLADVTKKKLVDDIRNPDFLTPLPREAGGFFIKTWEERNANLLKAVKMEKLLIRMMMFFLVFAASATIFLVLFMTVHSKVRELGILRAVGATRSGVLSLFVGQGFLIAGVSMLLGALLGYVVGLYINEIADQIHIWTGWHPFPPDVYYLDEIPVKFELSDTLTNFLVTLCLGAVAAIVPGLLAALRPPLKSIRYD